MSKKRSEVSKIFSSLTSYGGRVPLKSNIIGSGGYKAIGGSNMYGADVESNRSIVTGNATTDKNLSTYYQKMSEIKTYEMTDLTDLITSLFRDYVVNFMNKNGDIVSIKNEDGTINEPKTQRLNKILRKDLRIQDIIADHLNEIIYYGGYHFLITKSRDESGHILLNRLDLYDPVVVVTRVKDDKTTYICRGKDGTIYEVPYTELIKLSISTVRLRNDMDKDKFNPQYTRPDEEDPKSARDIISVDSLYLASLPIYYSITHKVKEYLLKDIIVSLLSIKDLVQPILLMIHMDKGTSLEAANELTKKAEALINNYTDLSTILTSQFSLADIIDALLNNIRVLPDYNSSLTNMGTVELNKINQKIQEMRMELDNCKDSVLNTMGISLDLAQGRMSKWDTLKASERLNSRVNAIITGLKNSIAEICNVLSNIYYEEDMDEDQVEVLLFNRTTVEYNNLINTSESITQLTQQINNVVEMALRTLEMAGPFFNQVEYLNYVANTLKIMDPTFDKVITEESLNDYITFLQQKLNAGMTPDEGY